MDLEMLRAYRRRVDQESGITLSLNQRLDGLQKEVADLSVDLDTNRRALEIVYEASQAIQRNLEIRISSLVTETLRTVFPDPYEFKIRFEVKRNNTEARLLFVREGEEFDPLTAAGGGVVDVAAFALRLSALLLTKTISAGVRDTIILDEPFRFVSQDLQPRIRTMLDRIAQDLQIQFIIVTHEHILQEGAAEHV